MIEYNKGAFGVNLMFRFHGSAVYKTIVPGLVSVMVYWFYQGYYSELINATPDGESKDLGHPYAIGVLVSAVSFLIIFRANNSYQRYWNACGDIHHFMSKTLDATVHTAVFHMQCDHYISIKPPSFYDYPELIGHNLSRETEIFGEENLYERREKKSINVIKKKHNLKKRSSICEIAQDNTTSMDSASTSPSSSRPNASKSSMFSPSRRIGMGRLDGGWGLLNNNSDGRMSGSYEDGCQGFGNTPSLFLQELAHLSSLYVAVAFSTLRNDVDGAQSPLDTYIPGSEWPAADPNHMSKEERKATVVRLSLWHKLAYWLGFERSSSLRTKINAARPMLVVGGVSENEIIQLQKARGASAKTCQAFYWLSEFIIREQLAGSTGKVAPPIISRLFQFLSDGSTFYNHARKTMYIPFPFPHAQLSAFFVMVIVIAVPFMMNEYVYEPWLGVILTFLSVSCLAGLHEVGRELENPFKNAPNDIPLCTLLAMYNESLVIMCSGFHPDAYWNRGFAPRRGVSMGATNTAPPPPPPPSQPSPIPNQQFSHLKAIIERQNKEIQELRSYVQTALEANDQLDEAAKLD